MFESRQLLLRIQLFPGARIYLSANTIYVKQSFGRIQALGLEAQVLDMVVPTRMFAEGRQACVLPRGAKSARIFEQEFFEKVAHRASGFVPSEIILWPICPTRAAPVGI